VYADVARGAVLEKSLGLGKFPLSMGQLLQENISLHFPGEGKNDEEITIYTRNPLWYGVLILGVSI
jgi:hypothetical protein